VKKWKEEDNYEKRDARVRKGGLDREKCNEMREGKGSTE
jgi:hypothetical protein